MIDRLTQQEQELQDEQEQDAQPQLAGSMMDGIEIGCGLVGKTEGVKWRCLKREVCFVNVFTTQIEVGRGGGGLVRKGISVHLLARGRPRLKYAFNGNSDNHLLPTYLPT